MECSDPSPVIKVRTPKKKKIGNWRQSESTLKAIKEEESVATTDGFEEFRKLSLPSVKGTNSTPVSPKESRRYNVSEIKVKPPSTAMP